MQILFFSILFSAKVYVKIWIMWCVFNKVIKLSVRHKKEETKKKKNNKKDCDN